MARAASDLPICLLLTQQPFASRGSYVGCWLAPDWHGGLFRVGCFKSQRCRVVCLCRVLGWMQ